MSEFEIGDYVVYTYNLPKYSPGETFNNTLYGKIGKVVGKNFDTIQVEFLDIVRSPEGEIVGHNCHGYAKSPYGWDVYQIYLRHIDKEEENNIQNIIDEIERKKELKRTKFLEIDPYGEDDWEEGMFEGRSIKGLEYKGKLIFPKNPYLNTDSETKKEWQEFIKDTKELIAKPGEYNKCVEFYEKGKIIPIYRRLLCKRLNISTKSDKIKSDNSLPNGGLFKMTVKITFFDFYDRPYEVETKLSKGLSYYDKAKPEPLKEIEKWWLENSSKKSKNEI